MIRSFYSLLLGIICFSSVRQSSGLPQMNGAGHPVVDVNQGKIIGNNETKMGVNVFTFRGIPYAVPPVGPLRFAPPVAASPFSEDLAANYHPSPCTRPGVGKEDCLYLNVYTPESVLDVNQSESPLAVMVWIHGGAFFTGSIRRYDDVYPMISRNVIVVTIQYRLGIMGFFSTEDDVAPGNYGLMDQTLALQWINANIADFGGDVNRITLFGQSAGAASVSHQMLISSASGLFRNAIMMSGNSFNPWGMGRQFDETSKALAQGFGCPSGNSKKIVDCLRDVDAMLLANTTEQSWDWNFQPVKYAPRVDGTYITDEPATLLKEGSFSKVPIITGICRNEMAIETGQIYLWRDNIDLLVDDFEHNGPPSLELLEEEDALNTATLVYDHYTGGLNFTNEASPQVNKMYTDAIFTVRHDWYVQTVGNFTPMYTYSMDYDGPGSAMSLFYAQGLYLPQGKDWISHADDVKYLFGWPVLDLHPGYKKMQNLISELFTNFAKFGTPTPDNSTLGFQWPTSNVTVMDHLSLNLARPVMVADERETDRAFWETLPIKINLLLNSASITELSYTLVIFSMYLLCSNYI